MQHHETNTPIPWKLYTFTVLKVWLTFCITTFALGIFITHGAAEQIPLTLFMIACYLFVIIVCIKRLIERLSVAALMLLVPIAPLAILLLIVSLLPIWQRLL